ncbi:TIGR00270 family protein [Candidatus Bathyarchaeota archaeon]|nr:MAG: TIGR00270 family protein [Candidatus Bathyarchaeota archaeon]
MRTCEVCGREIVGPAYLALIEGAELVVCAECTRYAKWFKKLGRRIGPGPARPRPRPSPTRQREALARAGIRIREAEELELVEDFGRKVREAREAKGLTQEELGRMVGEKASVISRIESGRMAPDLVLARKLEHALGIKLLVRARGEGATVRARRASRREVGLTLGDILGLPGEEKG